MHRAKPYPMGPARVHATGAVRCAGMWQLTAKFDPPGWPACGSPAGLVSTPLAPTWSFRGVELGWTDGFIYGRVDGLGNGMGSSWSIL